MTDDALQPGRSDKAISDLFTTHGDRIYRLGLRLCDQPDFAEDLVQETFLRAARNWRQFDGRSKPLTWLYSIASRACYRMQRRRAGEPRRIEPLNKLLDSSGSEWALDLPGSDEDPLGYTVRHDEAERLHSAISTLPAAFRLPLVLKELEGLSIAEVAEILGIREATVKTRLHRARLTLRRELTGATHVPPKDAATHSRRQCADLLTAKLEAMDRGVVFPIENERICGECRSTLDALDRTRDLCASIATHPLSPELVAKITDALREVRSTHV